MREIQRGKKMLTAEHWRRIQCGLREMDFPTNAEEMAAMSARAGLPYTREFWERELASRRLGA
jgi:hypothetical protein